MDGYPTLGAYTDERGARFMVEMRDKTHFSKVVELGDAAFKSKVPLLAVGRWRGRCSDFVAHGDILRHLHHDSEHPQAPSLEYLCTNNIYIYITINV